MSHAFDFILVVSARADVFSVLLFVPRSSTTGAVSVSELSLVTDEPSNYESCDIIVWVEHEALRLGISLRHLAQLFSVQGQEPLQVFSYQNRL